MSDDEKKKEDLSQYDAGLESVDGAYRLKQNTQKKGNDNNTPKEDSKDSKKD